MDNEDAYLARVSAAQPAEFCAMVLQSSADQQRLLRIYLGDRQFEDIHALAAQSRGLRDAPPKLGNVVVLHGIMGSELSLFNGEGQDLVWVNALHLAEGQFDRLPLNDATGLSVRDVRPTGIYMRYYGKQLATLSQHWDARAFFYDWRRDIRAAADDLRHSIDSWFGFGAPVHLVAHSMGGLVARCYTKQHADRWAKGGRLVMLGTPNYGSFATVKLLQGTNDILRTLTRLDVAHWCDPNALLRVAATFTSAYQMLPVPARLHGLDVLYQAATYTKTPVLQSHLDAARVFQDYLADAIDPSRMVYVAGYNRATPAAMQMDGGFVLSLKGDGAVPHALGLLDGVKTFYVDEEHMNLPRNSKVLAAMTELLETGDQADESHLWKGLGGVFADDQTVLHAAEAARMRGKEALSPDGPQLADLIFLHSPPPPPPRRIQVRALVAGIEDITPASGGGIPIDAIAAGHYLNVPPTGAERDLDAGGLLTQMFDRRVLRGELGEVFLLPDARPGKPGTLLAIGGMGAPAEFGVPELTLLAHNLCWTLASLKKRHLATVLIGAGSRNLSIADAVHGWLLGLQRAAPTLEAITFVVRDNAKLLELAAALRHETASLKQIVLVDLPVGAPPPDHSPTSAPTRISVEFVDAAYRFSAMTRDASIAERIVRVTPQRVSEINDRLVAETDPVKQFALGRFLLHYLFPRDLRAMLRGSAPIVLACDNASAQIHWELAAQPGGDAEQFLGLARGLTRQLRTTIAPPPQPGPAPNSTPRVLLVADGCREHPLPGAQREALQLAALFEKERRIECTKLIGPADATALNVLLAINEQGPFDAMHYAGHCSASGFLFSGGDVLTASDLDRLDSVPKFVFANACESGVLPTIRGLAPVFAEAFFEKGIANFVCSAWPVGDDAALNFALELYTQLLSAQPMYQAMRSARTAIQNTPTWGAYQHYGNPNFRLFG